MKSLFEQLGGTYTRQGDYCLPDVCLPPEEECLIGIYGQRRRAYLKEHHRILYYNLLTAGTLDGHLADIEEQAQELFLRLVEQYADTEGVTEKLKASKPQSWVRNNVIVLSELCQTKFDIVPNFIRARGQKLSGTSASLLIDSCARTSAS